MQQGATVCILGLGYIGLPTAAMLALGGYRVFGYDINSKVVASLQNGALHVAESSVRDLVLSAAGSGALTFHDRLDEIDASAYVICVPTPTIDHKPDLRYVADATVAIAPRLRPGDLILLESTVPPGTTERVIAARLRAAGLNPDDYRIAHCPERVIPGAIVEELTHNDRVIGGRRPGDAEAARELYASFTRGGIHLTDCVTAELVKVIENTYRDVNIAFANELALLAEELDVDAREAIALANNHPRVNILSPGPGVGGHCIPVDPHFLSNANPFVTELIQTARRINERMPHVIVKRVLELAPLATGGSRVALLGAAYKANVDDTRESPTTRVEELLHESGYQTTVYDPIASSYGSPLAPTIEAALDGVDAIVLLAAHTPFASIDPELAARLVRRKVLVDGQAFLDADRWRRAGFTVYALGTRRSTAAPATVPA